MGFKLGAKRLSRNFILRLERLDDRALPSVSVVETGGTLVVHGDQSDNTIVISDDGTSDAGNVVVQVFDDDQTYTSNGAITKIRIVGRGGDDTVEYDLNGNLSNSRTVVADLGKGDDVFNANVNYLQLNDGASLTIRALGGNGKDQLSVNANCDVMEGASLSVVLKGGNGKDSILENFTGVLMGTASFKADGGDGHDLVFGSLNVSSMSNGDRGRLPEHRDNVRNLPRRRRQRRHDPLRRGYGRPHVARRRAQRRPRQGYVRRDGQRHHHRPARLKEFASGTDSAVVYCSPAR